MSVAVTLAMTGVMTTRHCWNLRTKILTLCVHHLSSAPIPAWGDSSPHALLWSGAPGHSKVILAYRDLKKQIFKSSFVHAYSARDGDSESGTIPKFVRRSFPQFQ